MRHITKSINRLLCLTVTLVIAASSTFSSTAFAYSTSTGQTVIIADSTAPKENIINRNPDTSSVPSSFPMEYNNAGLENWLRTNLPAVRDQGEFGSCWAQAWCATAECYMKRVYNKNIDLSEWWVIHYSYEGSNEIAKLNYRTGPESLRDNKERSDWEHSPYTFIDEAALPYPKTESEVRTRTTWPDSKDYNGVYLADDIMIPATLPIKQIQYYIMNYGSIKVGINLDSAFYNPSTNAFYDPNTGKNHDVVIVGWDDNYPKERFKNSDRIKNNGAWLVRNSHGARNGLLDIGGYFWMSYESNIGSGVFTVTAWKERTANSFVSTTTNTKLFVDATKTKQLLIRMSYVDAVRSSQDSEALLNSMHIETDPSNLAKNIGIKNNKTRRILTTTYHYTGTDHLKPEDAAEGQRGFYIQMNLNKKAAKKAKISKENIKRLQKEVEYVNKQLEKTTFTFYWVNA